MRRHLHIAVTTVFAAMLATLPVAASASSAVLTSGAGGSNGRPVQPGDQLMTQATSSASFLSNTRDLAGVTCSDSSIAATVLTNPAAPGTATVSVTSISFSGCASSIPGTTGVDAVSFDNLSYKMAISDATSPPTATVLPDGNGPIQLTLLLRTTAKPTPCVYRPRESSMSASVTAGGLSFDVALDVSASNGIVTEPCLKTIHFAGAYGSFVDQSDLQSIFVN